MKYPDYDTEHFVNDLSVEQLIRLRDILEAYNNDREHFTSSLMGDVYERCWLIKSLYDD